MLRLLVALLAAVSMLSGFSAESAWASPTAATGGSAGPVHALAPTPVVSGNRIVDSRTGAAFVPHAVNWPSFEYACQQGWAYSSGGATPAAASAMTSWGITTVRLPLNEACWLGVDGAPAYGTVAGYRAAIRSWVTTLNTAGLVVILDLHWNAPPGYVAAGQRAMADSRSVAFWSQVATAYAASPSVLFDAFNEPYSRWSPTGSGLAFTLTWDCWKNGGCQAPVENDESDSLSGSTYPVVGMGTLVDTIRAAGATQPILLAGLDYANDLRGWIANRPDDDQLIASWHNYPGQRCSSQACWDSEVALVAASTPVMATEFGQTDGSSTFLQSFMTWADARGIGYGPWAWWDVDDSESITASRYALITDATTFAPKAPAGTAYKSHLASLLNPSPAATPSVPIYRFWSPQNRTHFFTASAAEKDMILLTYPAATWTYEGVAFRAFPTPVAGTVPLFRFWSPRLRGHFFTADGGERDYVTTHYPSSIWTFEGTAFYVYPNDSSVAGTVAVSRFWSPRYQHHFYTASVEEKVGIISGYPREVWTYEGDAFLVPAL